MIMIKKSVKLLAAYLSRSESGPRTCSPMAGSRVGIAVAFGDFKRPT